MVAIEGGLVTAGSDDFIQLMVPRAVYPRVVQFLAEVMAAGDTSAPPVTPAAPVAGPTGESALGFVEWTEQDFRRLRALNPNPSVLALLDLCAERPGQPVSFSEVSTRAGRDHNHARADLGGLTQWVKGRFGRTNWPAPAQWGAGGTQEMWYVMAPSVAERWLRSAS
jgi:hypothetical protein